MYHTCRWIAEKLGVEKRTVWAWIRDGKLKADKADEQYRVRDEDFQSFAETYIDKLILRFAGTRIGKMIPSDRLKKLILADIRGMVLVTDIPIGTMVYQVQKGESEESRVIDGQKYTRRVPNWYVTRHEYSWIDAIVDAEHPERANKPHCRYYFTKEEAIAECDRINAGGDTYGEDGRREV